MWQVYDVDIGLGELPRKYDTFEVNYERGSVSWVAVRGGGGGVGARICRGI